MLTIRCLDLCKGSFQCCVDYVTTSCEIKCSRNIFKERNVYVTMYFKCVVIRSFVNHGIVIMKSYRET